MKPKNQEMVSDGCRERCRKVLSQIARAKETLIAEWSERFQTSGQILRLALNEAEALAWQTMYPHLVFPVLAAEKVQAVAAWNYRQQRLWWNNPTAALRIANDVSKRQSL